MIAFLLKNPVASALAALCLALLVALGVSRMQLSDARTDGARAGKAYAELAYETAQAALASEREARATENRQRQALAGVAAIYEQEKRDAELEAKRVADDLRTGASRLRDRWQGCIATAELSADAAGRSLADAVKREREDSASRIIGAARACDAQVRGLQAAIRVMQNGR